MPPFSLVYNGHFMVCIFFVISGFVLSIPFLRDEAKDLKKRVVGRYLRLNIPIIAVSLLSYIFIKFGLYFNQHAGTISGSTWFSSFHSDPLTWKAAVYSGLWLGIFNGDGSLLPILWSLRIEFVGSLIILVLSTSYSKISDCYSSDSAGHVNTYI